MTATQKKISAVLAVFLCASCVQAGYLNFGHHEFTLIGNAWDPGPSSARAGNPPTQGPGGASWSVMAAGTSDGNIDDHGNGPNGLTTDLNALYTGGVSEIDTIQAALNQWAAVSGFTNLGQVADTPGAFGNDSAGDIRIGAIHIDGPSSVLAHAFGPGDSASGWSSDIGGDTHFDDDENWADCAASCGTSIDFYTVALHELGHALGLGHSNVSGSIMEAFYGGPRRSLHADDVAGIQAIYGVPEPSSFMLIFVGLLAITRRTRRPNRSS